MPEHNVTPPEASRSNPLPERRSLLTSAGLASLMIGLLLTIYVSSKDTLMGALFSGFVNAFIALPITAFIVWIFRAFNLPSRLELLAAVLAGAAGLRLLLWAAQTIFD